MKKIISVFIYFMLSYHANAASVAETQDMVTPLLNGQSIPNTTVTTITGEELGLKQVLAGKKTILFFYRGGWCPFCNVQMGQLQSVEGDLKKLGFQLVGVSTDSVKDIQISTTDKKLSYQLLSDYNSKLSQAFGLAFFASQPVTDRYLAKLKLTNPLQKNKAGEERLVLPVPAVYMIDGDGLVHFQYVNPNYKVRLAPELLLKAAELMPE